ncbi:MAG: efflux RND transporter periplasmic adaptor subunit [Phycisphaerales bacterium]|nr:efflux RND transporter periplasmic adaptor subunit [Phycisphaerales bacterium]
MNTPEKADSPGGAKPASAKAPPPSRKPPRGPRLWIMLLVALAVLAGLAIGTLWGPAARQQAQRWLGDGAHDEHAQHDEPAAQADFYTCGMHPWVILPEPGLCPICHMDLVPLDPSKFTGEISIDPVVTQNIGVRIAPVVSGPVVRTVRTVGSVEYDETRVRDVNVKVAGWIEKLYVDYEGARVQAGEPLFDLYSPQLYASQAEYLSALEMRGKNVSELLPDSGIDVERLISDARVQLEYFDVTPGQIEALEQRGEPTKTMTVLSPFGGIVTAKRANEGMRVDPGMRIYQVADLSQVWVQASLYEYQLPFVRVGDTATMTLSYLPGQSLEGRVIYIYPYLNEQTRQASVRLEFDNPDLLLKPGMFAQIELRNTIATDQPLAPRAAIIDTGERSVAFVSLGKGRFEPRDVVMGIQTEGGMVEVLEGLQVGEMVVTSGQFLLDSEARMRESLARMITGQPAVTPPPAPEDRVLREPEPGEELTPYPLDICVVSDARLGSMGDPIRRAYKGRELLFCCESCFDDFEADPEKYIRLLEERSGGGEP